MVIYICGCGAIGSQLAIHLKSPDLFLVLIDDDIVEQNNIGTSAFTDDYIGYPKAWALAEMVWRENGVQARPMAITLESHEQLFNADLVVDCFDNTEARALTCGLNTLHAGVGEDLTGSAVWDYRYNLPSFVPRGENPVCTHQLGNDILSFTADMAWAAVTHYIEKGERRNAFIDNRMRVIR
jgi:hypothetical protein